MSRSFAGSLRSSLPLAARILCGLMALVVASSASAQNGLAFKFKSGDKLKYSHSTEMKQAMNVNGANIETGMNQGMEYEWVIKEVQGSKADMTQTITRFMQKMELPGNQKFAYDSKDGKKPEGPIGAAMAPMLEAMTGAEFSFKMEPNGELSDVKISEELLETIKGNPLLAQMGSMFTEDGMKSMISQASLAFPKEGVAKGKPWSRTVETKGPFGTMKVVSTYTYQGPEKVGNATYDKIDVKTETAIESDPAGQAQVTVKSQDAKGVIYFDSKRGLIAESSLDVKLELEVKVMGQTIISNQTNTVKLKLLP